MNFSNISGKTWRLVFSLIGLGGMLGGIHLHFILYFVGAIAFFASALVPIDSDKE